MSGDDHEIIRVSDTAVSEKDWEDQCQCDMNFFLLNQRTVFKMHLRLIVETLKRSQNYLCLMWRYLHLFGCSPVVCDSAFFIACGDTLSEFVIQVGEIRARGSCTNAACWLVELQVCLGGFCLKCCCPQNSEWTLKWSSRELIPGSWQSKRMRPLFLNLSVEMQ